MKAIQLSMFLILGGFSLQAQTYFNRFKPANYQMVPIQQRSHPIDSARLNYVEFKKIKGLENIRILIKPQGYDSTLLSIYKYNRCIKKVAFPFPLGVGSLEDRCEVADLDNNQKPDVKLTIWGGGTGMAIQLSHKVYIFNFGDRFRVVSFFDFSNEREYDMDGDSVFEILSQNYVYYKGHSYWVYNAFDFRNGRLQNVSQKFDYPLWTRLLFRSDTTIAGKYQKEKE